jgi:membrane protein YdbS with pleckstrin-like domain
MSEKKKDIFTQNRIFIWIAAATVVILLIPFTAMQFSNEVLWTVSDFITAGVLLFGAGSLFVLTARRIKKYRFAIGVLFLTALLYVWAELAVGIFTNLGS